MNGLPLFLLLLVALGAMIWFLLDRREQRFLAAGRPRHSGLRLAFAAFGILAIAFSGGCGALFSMSLLNSNGSQQYVTWDAIAVLTLPVVAVGWLIAWLALRRKSGA